METIRSMNWGELLDYRLFEIKNVAVTIASVLTFLVIVLITFVLSAAVRRAIARAFKSRRVTDEGTIAVTTRLTHYAIMLVGLGVALNTLGIDLTALFAAGAVFAVAIGFAMQTIVQNFVSGVILLVERSITPGDVIEIEGEIVRVTKMSIRTTHARTLSDEELIMPNSHLVQSVVTNYTLQDTLHRVFCEVGVSYDSDMDLVNRTLGQALEEVPWRVPEKPPSVLMRSFGDSSVNFAASVWINDPWNVSARRSDLHFRVWNALKAAGVTIAYPQMDVHFDSDVARGLTRVS